MWRFLQIREPDISRFTFYSIQEVSGPQPWNRYNIIHPAREEQGLRQDAMVDIVGRIVEIARSSQSHRFLLIVDQGEPQPWGLSQLPHNLSVFRRQFAMGNYNFYGHPPPESPRPPAHKWLYCPMGRADWIRTRWFDLMCEHDLLEHNNVSYLCTNVPQRQPAPGLYASTGGSGNASLIPFNNFEQEILSNDQRMRANWPAMHQCLFGISVETGSTAPEAWYTERIYNILAAGLIPVVIAGAGALGRLENLGFRIPDYINWRLWDQWPADQWGECLDVMSETVRALREFTDGHSIPDIAQDWQPNAEHNRRHWSRLREQHHSEDRQVAEWVLTLTHNLSNRRYQYLRPSTTD